MADESNYRSGPPARARNLPRSNLQNGSKQKINQHCSNRCPDHKNRDDVTLLDFRPPRKPRKWIDLHSLIGFSEIAESSIAADHHRTIQVCLERSVTSEPCLPS